MPQQPLSLKTFKKQQVLFRFVLVTSGCEAAVHAMRQIFESPETEAVILVDASNVFNSLNREAALRNIQQLHVPTLLKNPYREDPQLFIDGSTLYLKEGTTQRDPLAMAMYATHSFICSKMTA